MVPPDDQRTIQEKDAKDEEPSWDRSEASARQLSTGTMRAVSPQRLGAAVAPVLCGGIDRGLNDAESLREQLDQKHAI